MSEATRNEQVARTWDVASREYDKAKRLPYAFAEQETLGAAMPDIRGRRVLDVGCGTGFYTRLWRRGGAAEVLGIDLSPGMIDIARRHENAEPLGVTYHVGEAARLQCYGEFDVVASIWVLNYANSVQEHDQMIARCVDNLVSGGLLVALSSNPDIDLSRVDQYPRYGLSFSNARAVNQDLRTCQIQLSVDPPVEFDGYFWRPGIVEESMLRAGLADVKRVPVVPPGFQAGEDARTGYWGELQANAPFAVYTALKS